MILCANLQNYLVRVSVPSSAVLPSSWLRLAGQSASVDRFSSRPMILFSSGIPLILPLGFASLSATSLYLSTNTLLFYFIGKDAGFVAGVIMWTKLKGLIEWTGPYTLES